MDPTRAGELRIPVPQPPSSRAVLRQRSTSSPASLAHESCQRTSSDTGLSLPRLTALPNLSAHLPVPEYPHGDGDLEFPGDGYTLPAAVAPDPAGIAAEPAPKKKKSARPPVTCRRDRKGRQIPRPAHHRYHRLRPIKEEREPVELCPASSNPVAALPTHRRAFEGDRSIRAPGTTGRSLLVDQARNNQNLDYLGDEARTRVCDLKFAVFVPSLCANVPPPSPRPRSEEFSADHRPYLSFLPSELQEDPFVPRTLPLNTTSGGGRDFGALVASQVAFLLQEQSRCQQQPEVGRQVFQHSQPPFMLIPAYTAMNHQNYLESPQFSSGPNPRQAPSPSQNMTHANGMNGGGQIPGLMAGLPTPAGHQSDLNYLYQMVEELSQALAENRASTERIVAASGRVRQRAQQQGLSNDEIIASVAAELNDSSANLEEENSRLRKELEDSKHNSDENLKLCYQYAKVMSTMLQQVHDFKHKTSMDMAAWHRSYRDQLAEERQENLNLRCGISDMQASATRGAEQLRLFRRGWDQSDAFMELKTENTSLRQQCRTWKRMALRYLPSDDSEFSDDDDVIDPEEKKRLKRLEEEKELKAELAARHAQESEGSGAQMAGVEAATAALSLGESAQRLQQASGSNTQ